MVNHDNWGVTECVEVVDIAVLICGLKNYRVNFVVKANMLVLFGRR